MQYLLSFVVLAPFVVRGQERVVRPVPKELQRRTQTVFFEDFSGDAINTFHARWDTVLCGMGDAPINSSMWQVKQEGGLRYVRMATSFLHITPKGVSAAAIADSFTVEGEFHLEDMSAGAHVYLMPVPHDRGCAFSLCCQNYGIVWWHGIVSSQIDGRSTERPAGKREAGYKSYYPAQFDVGQWHRLGLSYKMGRLEVYCDSFLMFSMPQCGFVPGQVLFGGIAPVRFRNIRIASGPEAMTVTHLQESGIVVSQAILFDTDSASIKAENYAYLDELARLLRRNPDMRLYIEGHTDNEGSAAHNMALSEHRAKTVVSALVSRGVDASRLRARGFGMQKPVAKGNSEAARATNRRVEFVRIGGR